MATEDNGGVGTGTVDVNKALLERVGALATGLKEVTDQVKALQSAGIIDVKADVTKVVDQYEKMRAMIVSMEETIRTRKNGMHFSGLEDASKQFNFLRFVSGIKKGDVKKFAPFESEVIEETRKAMEKSQHPSTRAGHVMWDDSAGGLWVPDQVLADVIGPIYAKSVFAALDPSTGSTRVTVIDGLTGNPVKIPEFEGGMIAYWIGEEDDYAESKTKSGNITMTPKKLGILTRVTEEMMQLASPAFNTFLKKDMIRAAAKRIDWTVAYGTGTSNMPRGLFNNPKIRKFYAQGLSETAPGSPTAGGTELDFDGLMEMQGMLEDDDVTMDDSFATVGHPRYFRRLKRLKIDNYTGQATNRPFLLGSPFLTDERLKGIIGDFDKSTQIQSNKMIGGTTPGTHDKGTDVVMGNLAEVLLGRWAGIQILDDGGSGTGFVRDQTYVKMRMWADVEVRQPRAILHCPDAKARD